MKAIKRRSTPSGSVSSPAGSAAPPAGPASLVRDDLAVARLRRDIRRQVEARISRLFQEEKGEARRPPTMAQLASIEFGPQSPRFRRSPATLDAWLEEQRLGDFPNFGVCEFLLGMGKPELGQRVRDMLADADGREAIFGIYDCLESAAGRWNAGGSFLKTVCVRLLSVLSVVIEEARS